MNITISTSPKLFCFVLMPFEESFDDVYQLGIKESCTKAGAYCERVDEQYFEETILERIYNQIAKADLIIADMSGKNPNVFYEVGYAHALGKPTILMTQNAEDIPFDLKQYPHIIYSKKITKLKDELTNRIRWFVENPRDKYSSYKIDLEFYLGKQNLSAGNVVYDVPKNQIPHLGLTLHNNSPNTFEPGSFRIGVITSKQYLGLRGSPFSSIKLPDDHILHWLPDIETLFPQSYETISILLDCREKCSEEEIRLRIFTSLGTRDYALIIREAKGD